MESWIEIATKRWLAGWLFCMISALFCCASCSNAANTNKPASQETNADSSIDISSFLVSVLDEPETLDFQCTTIDYTIGLNCFNRLVEMQEGKDGSIGVVPSLAKSWDVSDDGRVYTFHLRDDVTFSNGSPLTSSDVLYSFTRLLTHPKSCNRDIVQDIEGAKELESGDADYLEGFRVSDDYNFSIALHQPFSAFLACLCMPGASILDQETTELAGDRFGQEPQSTVGTGPFVLQSWKTGTDMVLTANPSYWEGVPDLKGLHLRFVNHPETLRKMFDDGELDVLNLDDLGNLSEFFMHGDVYAKYLRDAQHIGIDYIALNESIKPLDDVRVRKALQLALDRQTLLEAVYAGEGKVENGIYPHGLLGFNPNLEPIPYDEEQAKSLLVEAGYADGLDLVVSLRATTTERQRELMDMVKAMWEKVGARTSIEVLSESEFMSQRKSGKLACYTATWAADYDDPDNFVYTFFGSKENTTNRSLCYTNEDVMKRVRAARSIVDEKERIKEYDDLERIIVHDDAAWIPLFSKTRHYVISDRLQNFTVSWNGWFETSYKYMSIKDSQS